MLLETVLDKYPATEDSLISILLEYQATKKDHFISEEEVRIIAKHLQITESKVCSVLSFYTLISEKPRGRHIIQVCKDVPCYLNDHKSVLTTLEQILGIVPGQTMTNQQFTLEYTSCLGICDKAPAMRIDGKTYTHLTPGKVKAIISEYRGKHHD